MGLRHRSIRLRVGVLIVVPVLCLIGLYAFAASITLGNALNESHAKSLRDALLVPLGNFQQNLDNEQRLAVLSLATSRLGRPGEPAEPGGELDPARARLADLRRSQPVGHSPPSSRTSSRRSRRCSRTRRSSATSATSSTRRRSASRRRSRTTARSRARATRSCEAAMFQQSDVPLVAQADQVINLDQVAQTDAGGERPAGRRRRQVEVPHRGPGAVRLAGGKPQPADGRHDADAGQPVPADGDEQPADGRPAIS